MACFELVWDESENYQVRFVDGPFQPVALESDTAGNPPIYQSYSKRIAEKTAPFSQNAIPLKDVGLFKKTAQQVESPTPIADLLHDLLRSDEGRA